MLKHLTILALAGALLPACVITDGSTDSDTDSASNSNSNSNSESGTGTTGTTGGTGTEGGTTDGSASATDSSASATDSVGTTESVPTTGEPTTGELTTSGTTEENTTGLVGNYGMCGWVARENFYGCVNTDGAEPGAEDPAGIDPIDCAAGLVEGDPCTDKEGPVTSIGCCTPEGVLYFCDIEADEPTIYRLDCDEA